MKGRKKYFLLSILLFSLSIFASNHLYWSRHYNIVGRVIKATPSGYYIGGTTTSYGAGRSDAFLIKTDLYGNVIWAKTYGGALDDNLYSITPAGDGGVVFCGDSKSFSGGVLYGWIVKVDDNGNIVWQKTYNSANQSFSWIEKTSDNGYIAVANGMIVKIDSSGEILWKRQISFLYGSNFRCVKQTSDSGFVLFGVATFTIGMDYPYIVVKVSSNGNYEWAKLYGGGECTSAGEIQQTSDGGYIFVGSSCSLYPQDEADVVKLDSSGNLTWRRNLYASGMGDRFFYCVKENEEESSYYIGGSYYSLSDFPISSGWLVKLDYSGNLIFKKRYTYTDSYKPFLEKIDNDAYLLFVGYDIYKLGVNGQTDNCSYIVDSQNDIIVSRPLYIQIPETFIWQDFELQVTNTTATTLDFTVSQDLFCGTDCYPPSLPVITAIEDVNPSSNDGIRIYYNPGSPATRHDLYRNGTLVKADYQSGEIYTGGECNVEYDYSIVAINNDPLCYSTSLPMKGKDVCLSPPGEVGCGENMIFIADQNSQKISWVMEQNATGYRVYRGVMSNLQGLCDESQDFCKIYDGSANMVDITSDSPEIIDPINRVLFYLVTGYNEAGEGTAGNATCGERKINSSGDC